MTYNRFLYNTALYNAGLEEVGAVARSIIQAHTGPHIQAVVGQVPDGSSDQSGIAFLSDFIITEGTVKRPPASYNFPDLSARLKAVQSATDDISGFIFGFAFKDLPAAIFLVDKIPDLSALIFALGQQDLAAVITEKLFQKVIISDTEDLIGLLQVLPAIVDLPAQLIASGGFRNLGARIHAPLDLPATLQTVQRGDLPADIFAFQFSDMPGFMFGQPAANLIGFLRSFTSATADLPSAASARDEEDMGATITPTSPGPNDILGIINSEGQSDDMIGFLRAVQPGLPDNVKATIGVVFEETVDLPAIIDFFGAKNIKGLIGTIPVGERDKFLPGFLQPVRTDNLGAFIETNDQLKNLAASIFSLRDAGDLGAFIRVSETFVTAILTVTTLSSRSLRATVGSPDCLGGSGNANISADITGKNARDLGAFLESLIEKNLGAVINTGSIIHAMDTIDVLYSRSRFRDPIFLTTDTIDVLYTRFRGDNLGAFIQAVPPASNLGATLTVVFPLPQVSPSVSSLLAAELRFGRDLNIQEVKLQLEGALPE